MVGGLRRNPDGVRASDWAALCVASCDTAYAFHGGDVGARRDFLARSGKRGAK